MSKKLTNSVQVWRPRKLNGKAKSNFPGQGRKWYYQNLFLAAPYLPLLVTDRHFRILERKMKSYFWHLKHFRHLKSAKRQKWQRRGQKIQRRQKEEKTKRRKQEIKKRKKKQRDSTTKRQRPKQDLNIMMSEPWAEFSCEKSQDQTPGAGNLKQNWKHKRRQNRRQAKGRIIWNQ